LPELERERRRAQENITRCHLAGSTHRVVVIAGKPCPTACAVADLVLCRHVPYSACLPQVLVDPSGQFKDATTTHSSGYTFRACEAYALNMARINAALTLTTSFQVDSAGNANEGVEPSCRSKGPDHCDGRGSWRSWPGRPPG
jgi:hypothetical protein